jgi:hypothetical protein
MEEFEAECFFSDEDFLEFLGAYWKNRIEGVLEEMEEYQATDEQKKKVGRDWSQLAWRSVLRASGDRGRRGGKGFELLGQEDG